MQLQPFNLFYKKYGIRSLEQIGAPVPKVLVDMPRNVAVHCFEEGPGLFPDVTNPFLEGTKKRASLINHQELLDKTHTVSRLTVPINQQVQQFIRENKKFVVNKEPFENMKDEMMVVVNNYNPIKNFYKYSSSIPMNLYWKWFDVQQTLWKNVDTQASASPRGHYVFMDVPVTIPGKSRLMTSEAANAAAMLKFFQTSEEFLLLDLWRWVNPKTRSLSSLGLIHTENLPKVTLMLKLSDGRYVALNLGYVNSWIEGQPNQTDKKNITQRKPVLVATMILLLMVRLQSASVLADEGYEEELETEEAPVDLEQGAARSFPKGPSGEKKSKDPKSTSSGNGEPGTDETSTSTSKNSLKDKLKVLDKEDSKAEDTETVEDTLAKAEEELAALEEMSRRRETVRSVGGSEAYDPEAGPSKEEATQQVFGIRSSKERLLEQLEKVVATGTMNAADYRKLLKTIEKQDSMTDPYGGDQTLQEFIVVTKEDQTFKANDVELVGDERILDPTMKKSVVEALDKQYIEKVMRKDIVATIMGIQNSGVVVTNINTEVHRTITGSFEVHSVTIKPIKGETSTLRIRIPVIETDGTYLANGVRYHQRKQRVDSNIRKTDPSRVGISSFTGKLAVSRPSKQAQSELTSVFKKLNRGSIGDEPMIPKVISANVLDTEFQAPYIYNVMAERFKGFTVKDEIWGNLEFDFSGKERLKTPGAPLVCGHNSKGHPIVVDEHDVFSIVSPNGTQKLGNIHEVLDIDRTHVPVDAAMLKVVGQQLPVGLVLCRAIGLRGTIKLLGCKYRTEDSKKRKSLLPNEYALTFKNVRYVFDRSDKQASLVLGGLTHFEKLIKSYNAEVFDQKDIYNYLLETMGCRVSVGRELDHLETSYVDPVTARTLEKRGEPQNFLGLLVKASLHLTNYSSPPPQDMNVQEIRGYERIAGAIHKQLYKALRTFKNKNISTRTKVDMGHFAVWQAIREDPAIKTCEDINPVQNLKMHESVTFVGEGGRSKEAFMKNDRAYNVSDAGVICEGTVDSGDVGINTFLSVNPKLGDTSGIKKDDGEKLGAGNYLSSSLMLVAGAEYDD